MAPEPRDAPGRTERTDRPFQIERIREHPFRICRIRKTMTDGADVHGMMETYVNGRGGFGRVTGGLCQGGCQLRHRRLTTDGITCEGCGAQTPLGFGQSSGRQEFEKEKVEFVEELRRDSIQHITVSGTVTRVVHCPPTGKCRVCITRSIERIADNRVSATFVCKLAERRKARFIRETLDVVKNIITTLTIHRDICKKRQYKEGINALNRSRKTAVKEIKALVAVVYDPLSFSQPHRPHSLPTVLPTAVFGLEDADSDMKIDHAVRSEGKTVDRLKQFIRAQFESVTNDNHNKFLDKLDASINACTELQQSHGRVGSAAATFLLVSNQPGTLDPMVRALTGGTSSFEFATPELHAAICIRTSTCMQTIPEAMLESIVEDKGAEHALNVVDALASSALSPSAVAKVIAEDASYKSLLRGVCGTSRCLATFRRMCCDDIGCKRKMCVGLLPFSSVVKKPPSLEIGKGERATDNIDAMWTVQTRLLGGFAACLSKRSDLVSESHAIDLVKKASKELFVTSFFFSRRVSEFVNAATALVSLHDPALFDTVSGRRAAKHDLSVQSLAIALGFWPKYFQPCFENTLNAMFCDGQSVVHRSMERFVEVCTSQHTSFVKEKGNATIDAALMYRRIQYDRMLNKHKDRLGVDDFANTISVGNGPGLPFPTLPPDVFKSEVDVARFAERVADCLSFTRDSARAGSSRDNALVRTTEKTSLSFDSLAECTRQNTLGQKYMHRVEAGLTRLAPGTAPDLVDAENGELGRREEILAEIKTRAVDLNTHVLMSLASAAAERVEATIPGFWEHTWRPVPTLAQFPAAETRACTGYHPAAGLFKRLDDSPYRYDVDSADSVQPDVEPHGVRPTEFANPAVQAELAMRLPTGLKATKAVQKLIDMEVYLSILMHGTRTNEALLVGYVVVDKPSTPAIDRAVSTLAQSGNARTKVLKLINQSFLKGLLSFCDSLVTRAMETEIRNALPSQTHHDCPVMQCALQYFDEEAYAKRAHDLHVARLGREVYNACQQRSRDNDAVEYLVSNRAQDEVYEHGEQNRPTYSGQKRACLSKGTLMIAAAALNGYRLLALLAGREWVGRDAAAIGDLSATTAAVESRLCVETGDYDGTKLTSSILHALEQFGRQKEALSKKPFGYSESSGARTKTGENDSVVLLTRPFHPSLFEGPHWNSFDRLLSSVNRELSRITSDATQDFVVVRAIEREAADLGEGATAPQRHYRKSVQAAYEKKTEKAQAEWNSLNPARKKALEAISASLLQVTAFDLFCLRGVAAFVSGARHSVQADPKELFVSIYCRVTNTNELTSSKKSTCDLLFSKLQQAILMLNTNRTKLSDVASFYRHRIFVQFLCEAAMQHGTMKEQEAAKKILSAGFCFLTRMFGVFGIYKETMRDSDDPSESRQFTKRVDEKHLNRLAKSRKNGEERANSRF